MIQECWGVFENSGGAENGGPSHSSTGSLKGPMVETGVRCDEEDVCRHRQALGGGTQ